MRMFQLRRVTGIAIVCSDVLIAVEHTFPHSICTPLRVSLGFISAIFDATRNRYNNCFGLCGQLPALAEPHRELSRGHSAASHRSNSARMVRRGPKRTRTTSNLIIRAPFAGTVYFLIASFCSASNSRASCSASSRRRRRRSASAGMFPPGL